MPIISGLNERIKEVRLKLGLTQEAFAELINYKQGRISGIEKPGTSIPDKLISLICINTHARKNYLLQGEGEIFEEFYELLLLARRVLKSKTHYAESLSANIKSFSCGLDSEQNVKPCEVATVDSLKSIRADDPLEKKEELLKLRTV